MLQEYDPLTIGLDEALVLLHKKASRMHDKGKHGAAGEEEAPAVEERKRGTGEERWPRRPRRKKEKEKEKRGEEEEEEEAGAAAAGEVQPPRQRRGRKTQQQQQEPQPQPEEGAVFESGPSAASAAANPDSSADVSLPDGATEHGEGRGEEDGAAATSGSLGDADSHIANKRPSYQFFLAGKTRPPRWRSY